MSERISDERLTAFAKGDIQEWQQNTFEEKTGMARELQQARARIAELDWRLISETAIPQVGDEVGGYDPAEAIPHWRVRVVTSGLAASRNARPHRNWERLGYTHFRPANPPSLKPAEPPTEGS